MKRGTEPESGLDTGDLLYGKAVAELTSAHWMTCFWTLKPFFWRNCPTSVLTVPVYGYGVSDISTRYYIICIKSDAGLWVVKLLAVAFRCLSPMACLVNNCQLKGEIWILNQGKNWMSEILRCVRRFLMSKLLYEFVLASPPGNAET